MSVFDSAKELKGWIVGTIAFDASVTTLLVTVFSVDMVHTTVITTIVTLVALAIIFLIHKSETRNRQELQQHMADSTTMMQSFSKDIDEIKTLLCENSRSTLRVELSHEMTRNPHNHDTILQIAEKYFIELNGDFYMTNRFLDWTEQEKVHVPHSLLELKRD